MPFVEIKPLKPIERGTGVRLTNGPHGISVSLSGDARAQVATPHKRVRVLFDADPAFPRLRLTPDPEGTFQLRTPTRGGDKFAVLRLGRRPDIATRDAALKRVECTWDRLETGPRGLDIDIPRELRAQVSQPVIGSTKKSVTLGGVPSLAR